MKKRHKKHKTKQLSRAAAAGVLLGITLSFGKILLSHGFSQEETAIEPNIIITDYTQSYYGAENPTGINIKTSEPLTEYVGTSSVPTVTDTRPVLRDQETEEILADLAKNDPAIARIYSDRKAYPEDLLMALACNQELTDFVSGYLTAGQTATGGFTSDEAAQNFPLFLQWDARWGYVPYGGLNIGISGCGPTCLSMVIFSLTRDEKATPDALARFGMDNGYYMSGTGTAWKLLEDVADMHGLNVWQPKASDRILKEELDKGSVIICSMKPGEFTAGGHFIVIYGYDSEGFLVNDPNCVARSRRRWTYDEIGRQIKNTWVYSAPVRDIHKDTEKDGWG